MKKILILFFTLNLSAQIQKVEPPFWWEGMKNSSLMITLYGDNLHEYEVNSESINIIDVVRLENPNYLFVYVDLGSLVADDYVLALEHPEKPTIEISYGLKSRQVGSALRQGYDSTDFIYLIMPDRFANGDLINDSHPDLNEQANRNDPWGRHGGD